MLHSVADDRRTQPDEHSGLEWRQEGKTTMLRNSMEENMGGRRPTALERSRCGGGFAISPRVVP